ncbi:hypothetical protein [Qaidamihabitans albus]|uniref:hypothetical protein n=1 Tax=Qaidamihabitans albus TaxID=2795733 RepID=UPI001F432E10|nr:hypothetical protein [Qaidamihabitans albus]
MQLEYDPAPPFDSGSPGRADPEVVATIRRSALDARQAAVRAMAARLRERG